MGVAREFGFKWCWVSPRRVGTPWDVCSGWAINNETEEVGGSPCTYRKGWIGSSLRFLPVTPLETLRLGSRIQDCSRPGLDRLG